MKKYILILIVNILIFGCDEKKKLVRYTPKIGQIDMWK